MSEHSVHSPPDTQPDSLSGMVALEPAGSFMRVFRRNADGVTFHDHPFRPFVLTTDKLLPGAFPVSVASKELDGAGALCRLVTTDTWHHWLQLRDYLQHNYPPSSWYSITDSRQQFLLANGSRLYEELNFDQLRVLCVSVTTSADNVDNMGTDCTNKIVITAIAVCDTQGKQLLFTSTDGSDASLLEQLSTTIQTYDPDIITGYNLNRTILPLLLKRAHMHGVRLLWGRNGSVIQASDQRRPALFEVYGRSFVDCALLVRQYDRLVTPVPADDLLQTAHWFGCPLTTDFLPVMTEAVAAHALFQKLFHAWHRLLQLSPLTLQGACNRSGLSAAAALMVQGYLRHSRALPGYPHPAPIPAAEVPCTAFREGRFGPIDYYDLSLLPSALLLAYRITPAGDELQLFLPTLREAFQRCAADDDPLEGRCMPLSALILTPWHELLTLQHPFGDPAAGHELARLEQVFIRDCINSLEAKHSATVLHDRQGIYCLPVSVAGAEETVRTVLQQAGLPLPPGSPHITSYRAIFSYKPGNFALLHRDGGVSFRGISFLASRREAFLREFLRQAVTLLLEDKATEVQELYEQFFKRLVARDCPIDWVRRSELLLDTPEHYRQAVLAGTRNRSAAYELALLSPEQWHRGDTVSYYITGNAKQINAYEFCKHASAFDPNHPDINSPWYAERLHLLYKRLMGHRGAEPLLF